MAVAEQPGAKRFGGRKKKAAVPLAIAVGAMAAGTVAARRRGYKLGTHTVVRCRDGHLFTTIWIPGASLKAVRLGMVRYQRCPVDGHWTLVRPVREIDLTDADRQIAEQYHDVRIP
ncbi:MAG: hypothetical protein ACRDSS_01950 [Actinocrinis sp.]